jgi:hypothetical protein
MLKPLVASIFILGFCGPTIADEAAIIFNTCPNAQYEAQNIAYHKSYELSRPITREEWKDIWHKAFAKQLKCGF